MSKQELERAIAALETQRGILGETATDAAQAGLKAELAKLEAPARERTTAVSSSTSTCRSSYSGDHRPNTGMCEGSIPHEEVNEAIRQSERVILFGQQTRLRHRQVMDDERLGRLAPGHRLSRFFYGSVRQLPERLLNALLDSKISVVLVRGRNLLVFRNQREHQAFHTGRTRRAIYLPEPVVRQAFERGYDYWALSEIIIQEAWPLLDYLLLHSCIERCQYHLRSHFTIGYHHVKDHLRELNQHRRELAKSGQDDEPDDEFGVFYRHYCGKLFALDKSIVGRDSHDLTDEIYDETRERFSGAPA